MGKEEMLYRQQNQIMEMSFNCTLFTGQQQRRMCLSSQSSSPWKTARSATGLHSICKSEVKMKSRTRNPSSAGNLLTSHGTISFPTKLFLLALLVVESVKSQSWNGLWWQDVQNKMDENL